MRYVFVTERVAFELPEKYCADPETILELLENRDLEESDRILGWTFNVVEVSDEEGVGEGLVEWDGKP